MCIRAILVQAAVAFTYYTMYMYLRGHGAWELRAWHIVKNKWQKLKQSRPATIASRKRSSPHSEKWVGNSCGIAAMGFAAQRSLLPSAALLQIKFTALREKLCCTLAYHYLDKQSAALLQIFRGWRVAAPTATRLSTPHNTPHWHTLGTVI